jgi:predicted PurR-regulated permease PerM
MENTQELRWIRLLLIIIALPVIAVILKTLKAIFIPLIIAVFLAFIFSPLTAFLKRKRVPMVAILGIALIILGIVFFLAIMLVYAASSSIVNGLPRYQSSFQELVDNSVAYFQQLAYHWNISSEQLSLMNLSQLLTSGFSSLPRMISNTMNTLLDIGWNIFLIVVFLLFILLETDKLADRLKKVMSHKSKEQTLDSLRSIENQIQRYLTVKAIISLATALVGMGLMLAFGIDFVLVCGILLFVLNFIPNIGSIIASAIPIVICALQSGLDLRTLMFSLLIVATQMLFGNIIEPRVQGNRLNLTPIMVLISLIFWGWLWGIVGMLICVPLTSAINILLKQLDPDNIVSAIISSE